MSLSLWFPLAASLAATAAGSSAPAEDAAPRLAQAAASQPAHTAPTPSAPGKGETPKDRDQTDPDGVVRRGESLTVSGPLSVAECMKSADQWDGKRVKVAGTVESVCAAKGCWFVIQDDKTRESIRITSKGYRFFVPRSAKGQQAVIEGDLRVTTLTEAHAKHLAEDSGEDPSKVQGDKKELQIAAVGLEMRAPPKP